MLRLPLVDMETGEPIEVPESYTEINLDQWIEFSALNHKLAKGYNMIDEETPLSELTFEELIASYPSYVLKVMSFWTGLTDSELMGAGYENVVGCFMLMNEVLKAPSEDKDFNNQFTIDSITYKGKQRIEDENGVDVPAPEATFIEGIEFLQMRTIAKGTGDVFSNMAEQIAVLYRPEGETLDMHKVKERADIFRDKLTMDTVWQIAFFLTRSNHLSLTNTAASLKEAVKEMQQD